MQGNSRTNGKPSAGPPSRRPRRAPRQRWLLVYNCHTIGLSNCLNLLTSDIELEALDPIAFSKRSEEIVERLDSFDRILVAPQLARNETIDFTRRASTAILPTIIFDGYHPDVCYLFDATQTPSQVKGPMGAYHSLICHTAFRSGLSAEKTEAFFEERVFAEIGYETRWAAARHRLLTCFREAGFNIAPYYPNWSRDGAFMYSVNHPRIDCLRDLACVILDRFEIPRRKIDLLPPDNLAKGPIYPVYPEIGSRLGVAGSYHFKLPAEYQCIGLSEFIRESFTIYETHDELTLSTGSASLKPLADALEKMMT